MKVSFKVELKLERKKVPVVYQDDPDTYRSPYSTNGQQVTLADQRFGFARPETPWEDE